MSKTFRRSNEDNRYRDGGNKPRRDGRWNGRYSREMEERELRSQRHQKKVDKREISLASLED